MISDGTTSRRPSLACVVLGDGAESEDLATHLRNLGAQVSIIKDVASCVRQLSGHASARAVFADEKVGISDLVAALRACRIWQPVVAWGANTSPEKAGAAIRDGAAEFLPLPVEMRFLSALLGVFQPGQGRFLHQDPRMGRIMTLVRRIAPTDVPVLVLGETGTGKEVLARSLHEQSRRCHGTFVSVNCAAIPDQLLESELFGYEKGAFTGAVARRIGKFEEADGGTLMLDEIGEMDLRLQAKLLRAIQEKVIDPIGARQPIKIDMRLIATTNRDLEKEVKDGRFREDLFYRLNVINISLPPLRERMGDVELLANAFLDKYADNSPNGLCRLSPEALSRLMSYDWPGNVRELENTIYRAALLSPTSEIHPDVIVFTAEQRRFYAEEMSITGAGAAPLEGVPAGPRAAFAEVYSEMGNANEVAPEAPVAVIGNLVGRSIADVEQELILATLDRCLGNRTQAANILGISIQTLRNKLERYRSVLE